MREGTVTVSADPNNVVAINPLVLLTRIHTLEAQGLMALHVWGPEGFAACLVVAGIAYLLGLAGGVKGLRRFGLSIAFGSAVVYIGGYFLLKVLLHLQTPIA